MKKLTSILLVVEMVLSMCSFATVFAAENLITSESFENGLGTWEYWGSSGTAKTYVSFVDVASDGKKALKLADNTKKLGPGVQCKFTVTPGETYKAELDYQLISGSPFGIVLRFLDSKGKIMADFDVRGNLSKGAQWNKLTLEGVAPEGSTAAIVLVAGNKVTECEILIDNVKIYGKGALAGTTAPTAPGKPAEPEIAPVTGDVIFAESFESGLDKWAVFSKKNIEDVKIVSTEASDGKNSLHFVDSANDAAPAYMLAEPIPAKPGETYTLTADFKYVSGNSVVVVLRFYDSEKKKIAEKNASSTDKAWKSVNITAKAPEGTSYVDILIVSYSAKVGEAYIDNIKLFGAKSATPSVKEETKLEKINKSSIVLFIGSPNALVNGKKTLIDTTNNKVIADTVDGRTLVPVRFIAENYGAEVGWDDPTQTVTLKMADKTVTIVLNKKEIDIAGKKVAIDVPAQTIQDRTMLPLRAFVEQVMGKTIFWDDRGLIVITDEAILDAAADKATIDEIIKNVK